jgi:hypothetical protein
MRDVPGQRWSRFSYATAPIRCDDPTKETLLNQSKVEVLAGLETNPNPNPKKRFALIPEISMRYVPWQKWSRFFLCYSSDTVR